MDERHVDDLVALLPALLESLEVLGFIARHLNPPDLESLLAATGQPDTALRAVRPRLSEWPDNLAHVREALDDAIGAVLSAFDGLRAAQDRTDVMAIYKALRYLPRAQEALFPLAPRLPPVSRFFMDPQERDNAELRERLEDRPPSDKSGVAHMRNEPGSRGGFSMYVPEYYSDDRTWPLVVALHGGAGSGRSFLWSWLRDARSHGAILVAPTAIGPTWALTGPDVDTPNLLDIVARVGSHWRIDPDRMLLTGMSDGGTFTYVSGLEPSSPFTHLAPIAAAFHPMLAEMADPERMSGLPIHLAHGALDWMFPVEMARAAQRALAAAGAAVTYLEVADLSHTYPQELNRRILTWLDGG